MPRGPSKREPVEVSHEDEQKALEAVLSDLRRDGWKKHQIYAFECGWEWAFDTGADRPEDDSDAARDLADGIVDDDRRKWGRGGKEACADHVYNGINAARKLQYPPETHEQREARLAEIRKEIKGVSK